MLKLFDPPRTDFTSSTTVAGDDGRGWKILMVAGEVSGDLQGSCLAEALLARDPGLRLFGTGGPRMKAAGVDLRIETTQFSSTGILEAIPFLFSLRRILRELQAMIVAERPTVAILIDNHGFNLAVAKFLKRQNIPVIYYFPPQAWVASSVFAGGVVRNSQLIISAFEEEAEVYRHHGGRAVSLGHPLLDIVKPGPDPSAVLRRLGIDESRPLMALLPGSRKQEIEWLAAPMFGAAAIIQRRIPGMQFVLPVASRHLKPRLLAICEQMGGSRDIIFFEDDIYTCLSRCAVVITTTGTATLETALLGVPMVAAYRLHPFSAWLGRMFASTQFLAMPNLLLDELVVPEVLQRDVTAGKLAHAALEILEDPARAAAMKARFRQLPGMLGGWGALQRVADLVFREPMRLRQSLRREGRSSPPPTLSKQCRPLGFVSMWAALASFLLPALAGFFLAWTAFAPQPAETVATPLPALASPQGVSPAPVPNTAVQDSAASARERLKDALKGDDPLGGARRVLQWLESATADDFRELAKDMKKFPFPNWSADQSFRDAYSDGVVARWVELDPDGLISAAMSNSATPNTGVRNLSPHEELEWLMQGLGRTRPELTLEKLPLMRGEFLAGHARIAFSKLAARDANAARRFVDRLESTEHRRQATIAITWGVAETDPVSAVWAAAELKDDNLYFSALEAAKRIGPGAVREVVAAAPEKYANLGALPRLILSYPSLAQEFAKLSPTREGLNFGGDLTSLTDETTPEQREQFLANYDSLPVHIREPLAAGLVSTWARTEPDKAAEWALAHAEPTNHESKANDATCNVFLRWYQTDTEAATAWFKSLPSSPLRDRLSNEACAQLADRGRIEEAIALYRPLGGKEQDTVTQMLAQNYAGGDPAAAASWIVSLPPEVPIDGAVTTLIRRWLSRDADGVSRWMESLPASARRDEMIGKFIESAGMEKPAGLNSWVEQILDPDIRLKAASYAFWTFEDRAAAREWMRNLKGVDPDKHADFLRTMP